MTPMDVAKYLEQVVQNPASRSSIKLQHAGWMGGALLVAFKITVGMLQDEWDKNQQLQERLQTIQAAQLTQRLIIGHNKGERVAGEKSSKLADRYAVWAERCRQQKSSNSHSRSMGQSCCHFTRLGSQNVE